VAVTQRLIERDLTVASLEGLPAGAAQLLDAGAREFLADLHVKFNARREELLRRRLDRQAALDAGQLLDFLPETRDLRSDDWRVAQVPADLAVRKVEITGPTDRKMVINALNSGASTYMADFEDANTPSWENLVRGQLNLTEAIERTITHREGAKDYRLKDGPLPTLIVRPRGWHLVERHVHLAGQPLSGSLFDFGLYFYHNARRLIEKGSGPYFYLPKMESHLEARLWEDVFTFSEQRLGIAFGSVKATVLIETIPAAFEMDEILYELRDHSAGLNAGRWDYIFSIIKKFRHRQEFVLPDRGQVTMGAPFMRAYTQLLVKTCHRRGAHAVGGMAAFIPSRRDPAVNEVALAKVREDKEREAADGFDGTWVAHPDLVPVAMEVFDRELGDRPNQLERQRDDFNASSGQLLDMRVPGAEITLTGLRVNVSVGIQYLESWLRGVGAAAINNLMEDAATAEISRSQVWQWLRHGARLSGGTPLDRPLVLRVIDQELDKIRQALGDEAYRARPFDLARELFEQVALSPELADFLTPLAYERLA